MWRVHVFKMHAKYSSNVINDIHVGPIPEQTQPYEVDVDGLLSIDF